MSGTVRREILLPQPPAQVWRAITDSATLAGWMFPNDFQPRVGHRFTFRVPGNPKMKFDGLTSLIAQIGADADQARALLMPAF